MVPVAMVAPRISDVLASTRSTLKIIFRSEAPMDLAASMTPVSTSFREDSTSLAMYGAAVTTNGMIVAEAP